MHDGRDKAMADFWRMIRWIVVIGILMVALAVTYLAMSGDLHLHMVVGAARLRPVRGLLLQRQERP